VVTLNNQGKETTRTRQQAKYYSEELGDGIWLDMVAIPGGHFLMGSPDGEGDADERPQHRVTVPPFLMGKFSVTQAQWSAVAAMPQVNRRLNPDSSYFKGAMRPVEWEYACRAGTTTRYSFGDTITGDQVNCNCQKTVVLNEGFLGIGRKEEKSGIYRQKTTEAGSFPPNAFGLSDMHGNVREWCLDHWHNTYDRAPPMGVLGYPLARVIQGCCGAVLGSTIRGTAARPTASGTRAAPRTTPSVFGSSALPRGLFNCPLLFSPLALYTS
jgi:formylglycine-generating enzyme required for sulfatase activity